MSPNEHGDWLGQRSSDFESFMPLGDREEDAVFTTYSGGLKTNRDAWCYNFGRGALARNMSTLVNTYQSALGGPRPTDPARISWNRSLIADFERGRTRQYNDAAITHSTYRPFTRQNAYFDRELNDMVYRLPRIFPSPNHDNFGFYALNPGAAKPFSALMTDTLPDLALYGSNAGQFFARWTWEPVDHDSLDLGVEGEVLDCYRRIDNVTDAALSRDRAAYGVDWSKDDTFYLSYGVLHSPEYRSTYATDLRKVLPRIPLLADPADARAFATAGRELGDLHLGFEAAERYPLDGLDIQVPSGVDHYEFFAVGPKMRLSGKDKDRGVLHYNDRITLSGIPDEAYRYMLGSRSAIEWIIDRYYVKTDRASGIVNDPNDWSREVGDPRYILDLLARVVTVSLETMKIVDALPALDVINGA